MSLTVPATSKSYKQNSLRKINTKTAYTVADLGGGCRGRGRATPEMTCGFLITTGILITTGMWFIGVEVEQETNAPPPKKNPGSAPCYIQIAM